MQDKKVFLRVYAFFLSLPFYGVEYKTTQGTTHLSITKDNICKTLLYQSIKKAPGPNMHNFRILRLSLD